MEGVQRIGNESWIDGFVEQRDRHMADALDVAIQLDAIFFEDGSAVGVEGAGLIASFSASSERWLASLSDAE